MKLYKLTDHRNETRSCTQWGPGVTHWATGPGNELCTEGVIHAYEHPAVAVLMNPIHADFGRPILWEAEGEVVVREGPLKCGVKSLTTIRILKLPVLTLDQRLEIAIWCTLTLEQPEYYKAWAYAWLNGTDRTKESANDVWKKCELALPADVRHLRYDMASTRTKVASETAGAAFAAASEYGLSCSGHVASALELSYRVNPDLDLVGIIKEVLK